VVAIGYAGATLVTAAAFEFSKPRQWTWGLIDASDHVAGLVLAGVILAALR
jgi:hypothetical protein